MTTLRKLLTQRRLALLLLILSVGFSQSGCALVIMANKMIFGDPVMPSGFTSATGVDLKKEKHRALVICTTPHANSSTNPGLSLDLTDGIYRRMKREGIEVVHPDKVSTWLDDHGGYFEERDATQLAKELDVAFVFLIQIEDFNIAEENSPDLMRGRITGTIKGYELVEEEAAEPSEDEDSDVKPQSNVVVVYDTEYSNTYPEGYPVSRQTMTEVVFTKRFVDDVINDLSRHFHSYKLSETVR